LDVSELQSLADRGLMTGGLHPIYPVADVESAVRGLPGAVFAIEASHPALEAQLRQLVAALEGQVIPIRPGEKALYHAALVFTSNYGVTLYALAENILRGLEAAPEAIRPALDGLLAGMVANLRERPATQALTGPLARGDARTVAAHLRALQGYNPALYDLYRQLGLMTLPLVEARGVDSGPLRRLLQEDDHGSMDYP
jgi:predicted short-subunit dehydrogenase-like oxidoreductase (DUF2520 family)